MQYAKIRRNRRKIKIQKLAIASLLIGFLSAMLALALKRLTEYYEHVLFEKAVGSTVFFLVFPLFALSVIYFLRRYLFHNKENKGIREIFTSIKSRKNLPIYKIPSHFVNGLLTVAFGGSTGIEVSTVVASATVGSVAQQKANFMHRYKAELICAGIAAGITALFTSPFAGILFAYEVIVKKVNSIFLLTTSIAVGVAMALLFVTDETPLFQTSISTWHYRAIPWFILLGVIAGLNSVYLTQCVVKIKKRFSTIRKFYIRVLPSALLLGMILVIFPEIYGDGYHLIHKLLAEADQMVLTLTVGLTLLGIIILKPIATALTLAGGGDGGVFAPGIFIGGVIGCLTALVLNKYFNADVIPLNFLIVGMAAMLSACIHAPFTALFLVCGVTGNYTLFIPILISCIVAKYTAQAVFPYTVYTMPANKENLNYADKK
ncbi:MAG: chloride channel protein [Flavobacterium sp.]|nr:chloride channel protein [Flavobacterium sp.]